ncbi:MAG TPA: hypothetical protein PLH19_11080 [Anaerolineae bacterium]|nr:hypothetical protein [Anaerolineae bacterium]HQH39062.1 hypothetical protein [Anaerolineae bacterium]
MSGELARAVSQAAHGLAESAAETMRVQVRGENVTIVIPCKVPSKSPEYRPDKSVTWMLWAFERSQNHRRCLDIQQRRCRANLPTNESEGADQHPVKLANTS